MTSLPQQIQTLTNTVISLRALINGVRSQGLLYAIAGNFCVFGCKVTEGTSATDMTLALEGQASGDSAHLNPDIVSPALNHEEYPNISLVYGEVFESEDITVVLDDAPATADYGRYDIVYIYIGQAGPAVGVLAGTASEAVATDFVANGLDMAVYPSTYDPTLPHGLMPIARVYVQTGDTGIANARIADLRDFSGRLKGEAGDAGADADQILYSNIVSGLTAVNVQDALDEVVTVLDALPTFGTAATKNIPAAGDASVTEVVYGTDTRLTDARTPVAHTHTGVYDPAGTATTAVAGHNSAVDHAALVTAKNLLNNFFALPSLGILIVSSTEPAQGVIDQYNALLNPLGITEDQLVWGQVILTGDVNVSADFVALILTENPAIVNAAISVAAGIDTLSLATNSAEVNIGVLVPVGVVALSLTEFAATIYAPTSIQAGVDALILTEYASIVSVTGDVIVEASLIALTLTNYAANINAEINALATVDALALTEYAATVDVAASAGFTDTFTAANGSAPGADWGTLASQLATASIEGNRLRFTKGTQTAGVEKKCYLPTATSFDAGTSVKLSCDGFAYDGVGDYFARVNGNTGATSYDNAHGIKMTGTNGTNAVILVLHTAVYDIDESNWEHYVYLTEIVTSVTHTLVATLSNGADPASLGLQIVDADTVRIFYNGTQVGSDQTLSSTLTGTFTIGPFWLSKLAAAHYLEFDNVEVVA